METQEQDSHGTATQSAGARAWERQPYDGNLTRRRHARERFGRGSCAPGCYGGEASRRKGGGGDNIFGSIEIGTNIAWSSEERGGSGESSVDGGAPLGHHVHRKAVELTSWLFHAPAELLLGGGARELRDDQSCL